MSNFRLTIADRRLLAIKNRQSKIGNYKRLTADGSRTPEVIDG